MSDAVTTDDRGALSILEFARWAGIGRSAVYLEMKAGRLLARKCRRRTIIAMDDARRWRDALPSFLDQRSCGQKPSLALKTRRLEITG
jgi:hypothetical protein